MKLYYLVFDLNLSCKKINLHYINIFFQLNTTIIIISPTMRTIGRTADMWIVFKCNLSKILRKSHLIAKKHTQLHVNRIRILFEFYFYISSAKKNTNTTNKKFIWVLFLYIRSHSSLRRSGPVVLCFTCAELWMGLRHLQGL